MKEIHQAAHHPTPELKIILKSMFSLILELKTHKRCTKLAKQLQQAATMSGATLEHQLDTCFWTMGRSQSPQRKC